MLRVAFRLLRRAATRWRAYRIASYRWRENGHRMRTRRISVEAVRRAVAWEDEHRAKLEAPPSDQVVEMKDWRGKRRKEAQ